MPGSTIRFSARPRPFHRRHEAKPYLFLKDGEVSELYEFAQKKSKEGRVLASLENAPESDVGSKVKILAELARLDPSNATYESNRAYYGEMAESNRQRVAAQKAKAKRKATARRAEREKKLAAENAKQNAIAAKFGEAPIRSA